MALRFQMVLVLLVGVARRRSLAHQLKHVVDLIPSQIGPDFHLKLYLAQDQLVLRLIAPA